MGKIYSDVSVSVVIPALNEGSGIYNIVKLSELYADEIIVVDGHSSDNTTEQARVAGAMTCMDHHRGNGDAYCVGIQHACGDIIVFMDADGSHEPADIPKLVEPIALDKAELVVASRHKGGSDEWRGDLMTYLRSIGSGFLSIVINYRWGSNLTDVLNGFRAVKRTIAMNIRLKATDFDVEQHMIVQFLKHGYRVTEVQSHEY